MFSFASGLFFIKQFHFFFHTHTYGWAAATGTGTGVAIAIAKAAGVAIVIFVVAVIVSAHFMQITLKYSPDDHRGINSIYTYVYFIFYQ